MAKEQPLRRPLALAWQLGVVTLLPSKLTVMALSGAKPLRLTVAVLRAAAVLGLRLRDGLTVKVAVPVYVPSDTVNVWSPPVAAGMVNVQLLSLPLASAVQLPDVLSFSPSNLTVRVLPGW